VHGLPDPDAGARETAPPTAAELTARLNDAVKSMSGLRDVQNIDVVQNVETTLKGLGILARLAVLPGTKNFIWVTHGFPMQANDLSGHLVDFTPTIRGMAQASAHARIAFYTVDQSGQGAGADVGGLARQTLEIFASQTGGRWYSSGRTDVAIAGAIADARGTYRLAYAASPGDDRKPPKLRIDAVRKGVRLLIRENYFGQREDEVFRNQSRSPFDATDMALRVSAARQSGGAVRCDVRINPEDVFLERRGNGLHGGVAMQFALYRNGVFQPAGPIVKKELVLTQDEFNAALKDGVLVSQDVPVAAPAGQMRVMVFDLGMHGLGSVTIPVK
jgi:hypothetical protein